MRVLVFGLAAILVLAPPLGAEAEELPAGAAVRLGGVRFRMRRDVEALHFSPDGARLCARAADSLRVFDAETGATLLDDTDTYLHAVVLSADGALNAGTDPNTGGADVYRTGTSQRVARVLSGQSAAGTAAAFSPDGRVLVTTLDSAMESQPSLLRLWDTVTGKLVRKIEVGRHPLGPVAFSPDGALLAAGTRDGAVWAWRTESGERVLLATNAHAGAVLALGFAAGAPRLASASDKGRVRVWDLSRRRRLADVGGHEGGIAGVGLDATGAHVISIDGAGTLRRADAVTGEVRLKAVVLPGAGAAALSADGSLVAIAAGAAIHLFAADGERVRGAARGHSGAVRELAFSGDGARLTSVDAFSRVAVWDPAESEPVALFELPARFAGPTPLSAHGAVVAVAPDPSRIDLLSVKEHGAVVRSFEVPGPMSVAAMAMAISPTVVAFAHEEGAIHVWDAVARDAPRKDVAGLWGPKLRRLAFSPGAKFVGVANCGELETVRVIATESGKPIWEGATGRDVRRIALAPDERTLVLACAGGMVEAWNYRSKRRPRTWRAHDLPGQRDEPRPVEALALSHDGRLVATGGHDDTVRVWQPVTGRTTRELSELGSPPTALAFSTDGKQLAAGLWNGSILVWNLE